MKNFSLKFLDIMIGVILGLGFQWWPNLREPWQYIAFAFVYLDIIDYWVDYSPSLKKFPPKRELDFFIDIAIMFSLFLYIYTTQLSIASFLAAFVIFRVFDFLWLVRARSQYHPVSTDRLFVNTWLRFDAIEALVTIGLLAAAWIYSAPAMLILGAFIVFRITMRVLASLSYKKVHFA